MEFFVVEVPTVKDSLIAAYHASYLKASSHPNHLISSIHQDRPPPRHPRRLKRKHHSDYAEAFNETKITTVTAIVPSSPLTYLNMGFILIIYSIFIANYSTVQ
uniref:Ubiquitin carboxyl-terminal hydrolase 33 n=1 Tax=Lygus hesperus TaxID=30085 RepID=A0A0A9WZQ6_LYGHE